MENMDNYEKLQFAAKQISKLIILQKGWRDGQFMIEGEVIEFEEELKTKLKQKFAAIRSETITTLNSITP